MPTLRRAQGVVGGRGHRWQGARLGQDARTRPSALLRAVRRLLNQASLRPRGTVRWHAQACWPTGVGAYPARPAAVGNQGRRQQAPRAPRNRYGLGRQSTGLRRVRTRPAQPTTTCKGVRRHGHPRCRNEQPYKRGSRGEQRASPPSGLRPPPHGACHQGCADPTLCGRQPRSRRFGHPSWRS